MSNGATPVRIQGETDVWIKRYQSDAAARAQIALDPNAEIIGRY